MSTSHFRLQGISISTLLFVGSSCTPEDLELNSWQGEHVLYENSPSLQLCQGTHRWVDDFVPFVLDQLELEAPPLLDYRWLERSVLHCPDGVNGCTTFDGVASSANPFLLHELVHATLLTLDIPYQPFFGEGIAVTLDPLNGDDLGPTYLGRPIGTDTYADPRPWMTMQTEELHYGVAGSFVSFLLYRHGPEKLLALMRQLGTSRDMTVIEQTFREAYALELDDEAELFIVGTPCTADTGVPVLYDCTAPEVPWPGNLHLSGELDCAHEDVAGGFSTDANWSSLRSMTFTIPTTADWTTDFSLNVESTGPIMVQIGPCFGCPWRRREGAARASETAEVALAGGLHYMRILGRSDTTSSYTVNLDSHGPSYPTPQ